jgi:hypothetical protein
VLQNPRFHVPSRSPGAAKARAGSVSPTGAGPGTSFAAATYSSPVGGGAGTRLQQNSKFLSFPHLL